MEFVIVGVLLVAVVLALLIGSLTGGVVHKKHGEENTALLREPCPICGSPLARGERIRSVVYAGGSEPAAERVVHVFGCPHCYPPDPAVRRICPVCHGTIPDDGYVVGRMWDRKERKHLHLLGCTICRGSSSRP